MTFEQYVDGVDFRFVQPDAPRPKGWVRLAKVSPALAIAFEFANTKLPCDEAKMKRQLSPLKRIPRMCTLAIAAIINQGVSHISDDSCFLNVGVWNGFTFLAGLIGHPKTHCIGVDNFSQFGGPVDEFMERFERFRSPQHQFFNMDYVEYMTTIHSMPIGFYLYDGEHSYENQLRGLQVAEPFFTDDCIVMVDDANLPAVRNATLDFMKGSSNKYRMLLDQTTFQNTHVTLWNGLMVLRRTR